MNAPAAETLPKPRLPLAELRARWLELADDPLVAAIPFKVELNEKGEIVVTPASTRHAMLQAFVCAELRTLLPHGTTFAECPVETDIGVRIPDVTWASPEFLRRHGLPGTFDRAPDLCVEVVSPSNSKIEMREKSAAYLAAGAREVWLVSEDGTVEIFDASGRIEASSFGVVLTPPR